MKKLISMLLAVVTLSSVSVSLYAKETDISDELQFEDVTETHWAYDSVMRLKELGLVHGQSERNYVPGTTISSLEVAQAYYNIDGVHEMLGVDYEEARISFEDLYIPNGKWYSQSTAFACYAGIIPVDCRGLYCGLYGFEEWLRPGRHMYRHAGDWDWNPYNSGTSVTNMIAPVYPVFESEMTRADVITSLYNFAVRYMKVKLEADNEVNKEYDDYSDYIRYSAGSAEYEAGERNEAMMPITTHMYIDCQREQDMYTAMKWACSAGIIKGYPDGTVRPDAPVTRAEFAVIIDRFIGLLDKK